MKKAFGALLGAAVLAGCASTPISGLPSNVTLSEPQSYYGAKVQMVEAVTFERTGKGKQNASTCVSLNVDNSEVTLSDTSSSFVGPYSGYYYDVERSRTESGGATLQHSDTATGIVVAKGVSEYTSGSLIPVGHAVRYKLLVAPLEDKTVVQFKDIEQAQKSTGIIRNDGFKPLGSWKGTTVMEAYDAMKRQANEVLDCIYSGSLIGG